MNLFLHVLLSDVEPSHGSWLGYFLKIWADRYPFIAEVKGGSMKIRPKKIFVTSNFKIEEVFKDQILKALKTRFSIYDFSGTAIAIAPRPAIEVSDRILRTLLTWELSSGEDVVDTPSSHYGSEMEVHAGCIVGPVLYGLVGDSDILAVVTDSLQNATAFTDLRTSI